MMKDAFRPCLLLAALSGAAAATDADDPDVPAPASSTAAAVSAAGVAAAPAAPVAASSTAAAVRGDSDTPVVHETIEVQEVALKDGRTFVGRLSDDRTAFTLINVSTGKAMGSISFTAADIQSIIDKRVTLTTIDDSKLSPEQKKLRDAEQHAVRAALALNQAKQRLKDATDDRAVLHAHNHERVSDNHDEYLRELAKYPVADKAVSDAKSALWAAQKNYDDSLKSYQQLGGTKDIAKFLKDPK